MQRILSRGNFVYMYFLSHCGITDSLEGEEIIHSSGRGGKSESRYKIGKISSKKKICHLWK